MLLSKSVTTEARYEIISRNNLQAAGKFSLLLLQCIGVLSSDIMNHKSCLQVQEKKKINKICLCGSSEALTMNKTRFLTWLMVTSQRLERHKAEPQCMLLV